MKAVIPILVAVAAVARSAWRFGRGRKPAGPLQRLLKMFTLACAIRCCGVHEPSLACLPHREPTELGAS
jgi:hypothetical protein